MDFPAPIRCALWLLALLVAVPGGAATNPRYSGVLPVREWTVEETGGLPQSFVVTQHPASGLIYVGNEAGVLEFDGVRWRMLPPPEGMAGGGLTVRGLTWDDQGRLWGAIENGVVIYSVDAAGFWRGERFLPADDRQERWGVVWEVCFNRGAIWCTTTTGIVRVDSRSRAWLRWPTAGGPGLLGEAEGELWFRQEAPRLLRTHGDGIEEAGVPALPEGTRPLGIARNAAGVLQLEHSGGVLELRDDQWVALGDELGAILRGEARASRVRRFADGRRIFSTRTRTLVVADAAGRVLGRMAEPPGVTFGVTPNTFLDRDGGLWLANASGIRRAQVESAVVRHDAAQGLRGNARRLAFDGEDLLVASSQGLFVRRADAGSFAFQPESPSDGQALWRSPAGGWLMAAGQRFAEWRDGRMDTEPGMPRSGLSLTADPRDQRRIFVGEFNALSVWRRRDDGWIEEARVPRVPVALYFLACDAAGRVWSSSGNGDGVWRVTAPNGDWSTATVERLDGRPDGLPEASWQVAELEGEVVVFGARGIWRAAPAGDRVVPDARFARLPEGAATPVAAVVGGHRSGTIYVAGAEGWRNRIWRGTRAAAEEPWRFEELALPEARRNLQLLDLRESPDGRTLWIGAIGAVFSLDLATAAPVFPTPVAVWRGVQTLGDGRTYFGGVGTPSRVEMPLGQRGVRLEFAAPTMRLTLSGRTDIAYRTRAVGVDEKWTAWSASAERELTNLPPGDVLVEVQARNHLGGAGPVAALRLVVPPFWWETWWARALGVAAGALGVALIVRWFVRRQFRQRIALLEAQAAVQQERLRIARDMHDDLGSTLASIAHLSDRRAMEARPAEEMLGRIHEATRDLVQRTRDIVWAATPEHDTLDSLIEQLAAHAERTLGDRGIEVKVELPRDVPEEALGSKVRHDVFLAFKEAVNNAAKYSQARTAQLRVELSARELAVVLQDDGVGFAPGERRGTGHGLGNLGARLAPHGGSAEVNSAPGKGTTVILRLPRVG